MATRSQVHIKDDMGKRVTLYHHWDGYPENIIPLIQKARELERGWESGRAGKVASLLCSVEPMGFEPEEGHEPHGDVEYYYILSLINPEQGHRGDKPEWSVRITNGVDLENGEVVAIK